jgi:hypothetical protein
MEAALSSVPTRVFIPEAPLIPKFLPLPLLLLASAAAAQIPAIEPVYGVSAGRAGVTVRMASNGCTHKGDLTIALSKGQRPLLLIARKHPDTCRTPGRAEIVFTWEELGLKPGQAFSFANPLVAEPGGAAVSSGSRAGSLCQKLEVVAVAPAGQGAVRLLGPQGPLEIEARPLVAAGEVSGAEAGVDKGENVLRVTFTPEAAQRLQAWTGGHVGGRVAVLLDGEVLRIAAVGGPMGGGGIQIGGMDRGQALSLAAGLSACLG